MDSGSQAMPPGTGDTKAEFRKLSNDVANRKYRRHSPTSGSSLSDGSPKRDRSSSPISSRGDSRRVSEYQRRKDEDRELDRDSGHSRYKSGDSHRHFDKHTSRSSYGHSRYDDYRRHDKHIDGDKRHSHSGRESKGSAHSDRAREIEHGRPREHVRSGDKYSRDRYDSSGNRTKDRDRDLSPDKHGSDRKNVSSTSEERDRDKHRRDRDSRDGKRDYHRNFSDQRNDRTCSYEESKGFRNDGLGRENDLSRSRESYKSDIKDLDNQKEKKKIDDRENNWDRDVHTRAPREQKEDTLSENLESMSKKSKFSSSNYSKDDDEKQPVTSKHGVETDGKGTVQQVSADISEAANDLNAAKVAALKAAELVNRNLVGTGFMSADQKKKLLWGNKKTTTSEEPVHHWDSALFGDRERKEKFNKLMGVKGDVKMEHKFDNQDSEKQKELQMDLEKQYTAGLRRRDGRTVGLGL